MVNIDSLGLTAPQVITSMSSKKLAAEATALAKKMDMSYESLDIPNGKSDSASFLEKKIPSLTLAAMPANWPEILHHKADQSALIKTYSVYLGYRLALALVAQINDNECGVYR